jgi:hypothetical protein
MSVNSDETAEGAQEHSMPSWLEQDNDKKYVANNGIICVFMCCVEIVV